MPNSVPERPRSYIQLADNAICFRNTRKERGQRLLEEASGPKADVDVSAKTGFSFDSPLDGQQWSAKENLTRLLGGEHAGGGRDAFSSSFIKRIAKLLPSVKVGVRSSCG